MSNRWTGRFEFQAIDVLGVYARNFPQEFNPPKAHANLVGFANVQPLHLRDQSTECVASCHDSGG